MLRILVIDDRKDVRDTLVEIIETSLPNGADISVEGAFPLEEIRAYASYIHEHDVAALLLDERLNEKSDPNTGKQISYFGHDVVGHLRAALPDFPVYVVTTYKTDHDLVAKEAEFEDIVQRDEFMKTPQTYASRIQRAAMRFQESMQQHLLTLGELTMLAAQGQLSKEDQQRLSATREVLGLPFAADAELVVSDLIAEARTLASESEELIQRIKAGVEKK